MVATGFITKAQGLNKYKKRGCASKYNIQDTERHLSISGVLNVMLKVVAHFWAIQGYAVSDVISRTHTVDIITCSADVVLKSFNRCIFAPVTKARPYCMWTYVEVTVLVPSWYRKVGYSV